MISPKILEYFQLNRIFGDIARINPGGKLRAVLGQEWQDQPGG
jgi:hypothetical protein